MDIDPYENADNFSNPYVEYSEYRNIEFLQVSLTHQSVSTLSIQQQFIPHQSLLESWTHKGITGSRIDENLEVDIKEGHIDDRGENDQSYNPIAEMFIEVSL